MKYDRKPIDNTYANQFYLTGGLVCHSVYWILYVLLLRNGKMVAANFSLNSCQRFKLRHIFLMDKSSISNLSILLLNKQHTCTLVTNNLLCSSYYLVNTIRHVLPIK